ncbi:hypothetical protein A2U01_0052396 [Trifolium medium]|uniref:Uncharacterized protein n=1 Tax=Trifolium medium TaxID=97028 RepID=A0A392R505_9FABA|nr:hypothetical protein [Trifolium medium]
MLVVPMPTRLAISFQTVTLLSPPRPNVIARRVIVPVISFDKVMMSGKRKRSIIAASHLPWSVLLSVNLSQLFPTSPPHLGPHFAICRMTPPVSSLLPVKAMTVTAALGLP